MEPSGPEASDGPVFVDETGRRSKTYRRVGWVLATICAVYAVTLVVALLGGNSSAPWLPISGQEEKKPAEVEVQPAPTDRTGTVVDTPGLVPSASASDPAFTGSLPPSSSATATAPARPGGKASASASAELPEDGGDASQPAPGASKSPPPVVEPSSTAVDPPPPVEEPSPTTSNPTDPAVQGQEGAP